MPDRLAAYKVLATGLTGYLARANSGITTNGRRHFGRSDQRMLNWLKQRRFAVVAAGCGLAVLWLYLSSDSFQICLQAKQNADSEVSFYKSARHFLIALGVWRGCTGYFIYEAGDAITALATILIAIFTWTLWRTSADQGRLTKEALVVSTRAFVFIEDFDMKIGSLFPNRGQFAPTVGDFSFAPKWKNSGDTPTRALTLSVECQVHKGDLPVDFTYPYASPPVRAMIGPKANEWSLPMEIIPNTANSVLSGETNLYVWGRADYEDVFGNPRFTLACYRVIIGCRDREIQARFILHGSYNRTELDSA